MASTVHDFGKTKKFNKPTRFRFVRMLVVDNLKGQTVDEKVAENIKYDVVVKTDNYSGYSKIKNQGIISISNLSINFNYPLIN